MKRQLGSAAWLAPCLALTFSLAAVAAPFDDDHDRGNSPCSGLPGYSELKAALKTATAAESSGLNNQMWASIVNRDGMICAVAFSGDNRGAQWPGSRLISAQKAYTANAFSLDPSSSSAGSGQVAGLALSTANLYSATQPGGSLYGLQHSNPVDPSVGYKGPASRQGTSNDPLVGEVMGGVNVFGGGLALYAAGHTIVGGVGVSGDTSCADHNIAWRVRNLLNLDHMAASGSTPAVAGPASLFNSDPTHPDNIIFDIIANVAGGTGNSASGFGHPACLSTGGSATLPAVRP
ncbi:heme-binding protein [uncultured Paludibaculum sp.]|uniref:GlcG/HbpS family heme-binding protein n=1 Tax=uncultured Paludibaculum sp. TaxID=1765020 RepID=UPI002AAAC8B9|nr:heme-binding protein [uncultured Paludibaculum sp.]